MAELFFGIELSQSRAANLKRMRRALSRVVFWPFNEAAAEEYGRVAAELRRKGRVIQQVDIQIASIALSLGDCVVVSKDSDMLEIPGLKVENWAV